MRHILLSSTPLRIALVALTTFLLGWLSWTTLRAAWGESYATALQLAPNLATETQRAAGDTAVQFAPHDPLAHWARGQALFAAANETQDAATFAAASAALTQATQLSPYDYRLWLTRGRAHERMGDSAAARSALQQAVALAPNYFETHWALGNLLLRQGEREAAFASLQMALRKRPAALPLVFDYAWNFYRGDAPAVIRALAPPRELRGSFVALLIARNKVEDALALWRQDGGQYSAAETARVVSALTYLGRYRIAYEMLRAAGAADLPQPDVGSLLANGGFEQNFDPNNKLPFLAWQVLMPAGVNVALDNQTRAAGTLSLRLRFDVKDNAALFPLAQTIPVKSGTAYRLRFAVKTEALQSLNTPHVAIFDPADERRLNIHSPAIANGTANWREIIVPFTTPAATEAIVVRVQRLPCSEPLCPLAGRIWLDEFKLMEAAQ